MPNGGRPAVPGAARVTIPLEPDFEHGLVVLDGALTVDGKPLVPGSLAYLGERRAELDLTSAGPARALLIGGAPFGVAPLMWWNFVARTREEIDDARADWEAGAPRFGEVASSLQRIPAPRPPWSSAG